MRIVSASFARLSIAETGGERKIVRRKGSARDYNIIQAEVYGTNAVN